MKVLSDHLKPLFTEAVLAAFPDLSAEEVEDLAVMESPRDRSHGDFACPIAFKLAKLLGKSPQIIGQAIVTHFPKDYRIGKIDFVNPGYLNLTLSLAFLEEEQKILEAGFEVRGLEAHEKPIVMEYCSANAAKPMGAHHIITTILGDALGNLFEFMAYPVIRVNHLGDWGTNFGKILYAVDEWGDSATIAAHPNQEFSRLYVHFNKEADTDSTLDDHARHIFKALENGDPHYTEKWQWIVTESVRDLEAIFKRLGVQFDHILGESFYRDKTDSLIQEGIDKGLLKEGEGGAIIFPMGEDQVPAMLRKSDGATLYLTRDVATVKWRVDNWQPEAIFYVVDHAQSLHFQQDFAISKALGYDQGVLLEHVSFGRMSFADGSMSTRKGNVIKLEDLLDEAVNRAEVLAKEKGAHLSEAELANIKEVVGVASVKYAILSQDRNKDIVFDWDKIITLEGNSAPYLLYSYARAASILQKAGLSADPSDSGLHGLPKLSHPAEIELIRHMVTFPEQLKSALHERKPHVIAHFLYELCTEFNRFYSQAPVLAAPTDDEKRTRLGLLRAFMHQLKTGLKLLGIPVLERM